MATWAKIAALLWMLGLKTMMWKWHLCVQMSLVTFPHKFINLCHHRYPEFKPLPLALGYRMNEQHRDKKDLVLNISILNVFAHIIIWYVIFAPCRNMLILVDGCKILRVNIVLISLCLPTCHHPLVEGPGLVVYPTDMHKNKGDWVIRCSTIRPLQYNRMYFDLSICTYLCIQCLPLWHDTPCHRRKYFLVPFGTLEKGQIWR